MSSKRKETYQFNNLEQLREWLNMFNKIDLEAVGPIGGVPYIGLSGIGAQVIEIGWYEDVLSDGTKTYDVSIATS
jgi:hypothetical protein